MLNNIVKHWSDCVSLEIVKVLHHVVLTANKEAIMASSFLSIFVDEMITIDNQSWIFVHWYVVVGWKRIPILLTFECLVEGGATTNIKKCDFGCSHHIWWSD
jgi:hypothetical protein